MTIKEMVEVMLAFDRGEAIQARAIVGSTGWTEAGTPCWNWTKYNYRIEPKPAHRAYKPEEAYLLIGLTIWREVDMGKTKQITTITSVNMGVLSPIVFANGNGAYSWSLEQLLTEWKLYNIATHTFTDIPVGILEDV